MKMGALRRRLAEFREKRQMVKDLDKEVKENQPELIAAMKNVDPLNAGITFDPDDKHKGTAYVQQNSGTEYWDEEGILDYVKTKPKLRKNCMVEVFSMQKWEAEVAAGNVPPGIANGLKKVSDPPKPFIRFGKPGENSNAK